MAPTQSVTRQRQVRRRLGPAEASSLSRQLHAARRRGFSRRAVLTSCSVIAAVAFLLVGNAPITRSQSKASETCRYFARTGHYVCDAFLDCFDTRGGLEIFGFPLSEPFFDMTHDGLQVQYFQRARMELHPGNPPPYQVQLGLLIDELGYSSPPVSIDDIPAPDDPAHRYFPETQHVVSHAFLDAFRAKGGLDVFGYPRSEFLFEDGRVVQYFQRARMEWDRNDAKRPIQLTNVGELYIERFGIPPECRAPVPRNRFRDAPVTSSSAGHETALLPVILVAVDGNRPTVPKGAAGPSADAEQADPAAAVETIAAPSASTHARATALTVSASVRYPITGRTGTQTVFIYVNDEGGQPIQAATSSVVVHYPGGDLDCTPQPTDSAGFTWCGFEILSPVPGDEVLIDIGVAYGGLTATAQTFFMPWW